MELRRPECIRSTIARRPAGMPSPPARVGQVSGIPERSALPGAFGPANGSDRIGGTWLAHGASQFGGGQHLSVADRRDREESAVAEGEEDRARPAHRRRAASRARSREQLRDDRARVLWSGDVQHQALVAACPGACEEREQLDWRRSRSAGRARCRGRRTRAVRRPVSAPAIAARARPTRPARRCGPCTRQRPACRRSVSHWSAPCGCSGATDP